MNRQVEIYSYIYIYIYLFMFIYLFIYLCIVGYATKNECYSEQFYIKSGCYNEHRCYNERGGILSADVAHTCA